MRADSPCPRRSRLSAASLGCELTRRVERVGREIRSTTHLANLGEQALALQCFAHPFRARNRNRAQVTLPAGTTVPENPGFALAADGTLTFKRPFVTEDDQQFALLSLPRHHTLALTVDHPKVSRVTFETSFVPDECPVWANAHTISVEPYLTLRLAPGESRHWHLKHGFEV